jgi:hypothetical protein
MLISCRLYGLLYHILHARESPFPSIIFQALAKEIVMSRKAVNRLYENKAQLNSISMHLGESVGRIFLLGMHLNYLVLRIFSPESPFMRMLFPKIWEKV